MGEFVLHRILAIAAMLGDIMGQPALLLIATLHLAKTEEAALHLILAIVQLLGDIMGQPAQILIVILRLAKMEEAALHLILAIVPMLGDIMGQPAPLSIATHPLVNMEDRVLDQITAIAALRDILARLALNSPVVRLAKMEDRAYPQILVNVWVNILDPLAHKLQKHALLIMNATTSQRTPITSFAATDLVLAGRPLMVTPIQIACAVAPPRVLLDGKTEFRLVCLMDNACQLNLDSVEQQITNLWAV